jgi:viroplasmin and RNaseH domain-containing protein
MWYTVAMGKVSGICSARESLDGANQHVSRYSGESYKTFKRHIATEKWLKANLVASSSEPDLSSNSSSDSSVSRKHTRPTSRSKRVVQPSIIVLESVDTKTSVFGISVAASCLLVSLCQDGASVGLQEELAAATIDGASLLGTYAPSESTL